MLSQGLNFAAEAAGLLFFLLMLACVSAGEQVFLVLTDAQWRRLAETSARRTADGRVTPHYDPNMVMQFEHHPADYDQWEAYDAIDVPTLCLRGESSDLLLPDVAEAMRRRGPHAQVVTIPGCGHAPALNVPEQFALVERFLNGE